jgi:Undecaprenyl-phosphate galactose phosphotransferase WbaP
MRYLFAHKKWWGYPTMILGAGKTGEMVAKIFAQRPELGLKPIIVLDDDPTKHGELHGIPVTGGIELAPSIATHYGVSYGILAMPGVEKEKLLSIIERYGHTFPHLLIVPEFFAVFTLWLTARDVGGILVLELRQSLLNPWTQHLKRAIDILGVIAGSILVIPLVLVIALLIKLDSKGTVFFAQDRMGKNGRRFLALKFRSMYVDAEERLAQLLQNNPQFRAEYEVYHKLRNDPRVTRIGQLLRKSSLDELPQLWNVLRGEMSLVGPRAYMTRELPQMNNADKIILRVLPGITGFWQVSGRNRLSFQQRLDLDIYYVRNWSVWFDIYILAKTITVVLFEKDAY